MYRTHMDRHLTGSNNAARKSLKCSKCSRVFSQFKSLYQHLVQTHADVTPEEIAELEASHAKCSICLNVFRNEEILKNHMKKHVNHKVPWIYTHTCTWSLEENIFIALPFVEIMKIIVQLYTVQSLWFIPFDLALMLLQSSMLIVPRRPTRRS